LKNPQSKIQIPQSIALLNTDDFTGGAAIACRRLLKALRTYTGVQVRMWVQASKSGQAGVVALDNSWLQQKTSWLRFVAERAYFFFFEKSKAVRFLFNPAKFGKNIADNQAITQSDIIHLHWINFGFLSIDSLKNLFKTQKPIVWTLHDMWAFTGGCHHSDACENYQNQCGNCTQFLKNPAENDLSHQIWQAKKEVFQNANLTIVTCSQWLGNRAKKSSLFKDFRIETIPNPIDIQQFIPINKAEARQRLGLNPDTQYILFAAMNVTAEGKGFKYFQLAILEIRNQASTINHKSKAMNYEQTTMNTELLIFGDAQASDFESLPLKVNLLGKLSDVEQIVLAYSAASVFVIPSLAENLPNTIMEAMACGTPVVGFDVGGIPEMIDHQQIGVPTTGYLAQYKSSEDLALGIQYVLQNPDYETLCQNARKKVVENYSEEVIARKYMALYQSLMPKSEIRNPNSKIN
jgi:glycosyltransferase involved in cell wall biosynthesis